MQEAIAVRKSIQYTPFVILCAPRSGSTLLHTYLNYHNNIHSHGEILRELHQRKAMSENTVSAKIFKPYSSNLQAVGMKLFYEYFDELSPYNNCFKAIVNRKDVHIIHLTRHDILRLYVSLKLAEKTNVWSSGKPTEPDHSNKIVVDVNDYKLFRKLYEERQELFKVMFADHPQVTISYEELIADSEAILNKLQKFLNVQVQPLRSLLKKQNQGKIERYVLNCDELAAAGLLSGI